MAPVPLATIPSPPGNAIELGPLDLRAYGAMIGLGILAAVWIAQRRWARTGGDPEDVVSVVLWAVPAGVVGARLYHVVTDLDRFRGRWWHVVAIWEGGLGILGGLALGVTAGVLVARRRGMALLPLLDAAAPALPVAQAIGRWGNWFNQELYGRPTDLPWALEIDSRHRPTDLSDVATFHPTFLYESLWNLTLAVVLVAIGSTGRLRPGRLFACYLAGYAAGRILVESFRIDPTQELWGVRVNFLVAGTMLVAAGAVVVADLLRPSDGGADGAADDPADDPVDCPTDAPSGPVSGSVDDDRPGEGVVVAEMEPASVPVERGSTDLDGGDVDPR